MRLALYIGVGDGVGVVVLIEVMVLCVYESDKWDYWQLVAEYQG